MDPGNVFIVVLCSLVAVNYVVPRTDYARRYPAVFWAVNGLDLVVGLFALLYGVPGFESHPIVRFMVGLVVLMHLAQNFALKSRWDSEDRAERLDAEMRERRLYEEERVPPDR